MNWPLEHFLHVFDLFARELFKLGVGIENLHLLGFRRAVMDVQSAVEFLRQFRAGVAVHGSSAGSLRRWLLCLRRWAGFGVTLLSVQLALQLSCELLGWHCGLRCSASASHDQLFLITSLEFGREAGLQSTESSQAQWDSGCWIDSVKRYSYKRLLIEHWKTWMFCTMNLFS